jgi:DNA transformation protein
MISDLLQLPNVGEDTAAKLIQVGISTGEELKSVGTEQAFLRLQTLDPGACIHLLYGLDGAVQGISSKHLSPDRKRELREFHRMSQVGL